MQFSWTSIPPITSWPWRDSRPCGSLLRPASWRRC